MSEALKSKKNKNPEMNEDIKDCEEQPDNNEQNDLNDPSVPDENLELEAESIRDDKLDYEGVINDLNDRVLRTAAELQNVKRRAEQDIAKARDYSVESFAKDMLGVMDNLCRASDSISEDDAAKDERLKAIRDGVEITKKEMVNVFERNKIKSIDPIGEKFNHSLHQAMSQVEDADKESGTVVNVMQIGYVIKDRLIRPALVVVVK